MSSSVSNLLRVISAVCFMVLYIYNATVNLRDCLKDCCVVKLSLFNAVCYFHFRTRVLVLDLLL